MQKVMILVGCPASGKSTFAQQLVASDQSFRRLNKDDLRAVLGFVDYDKKSFESLNEMMKLMLRELLQQGFNVVVDNTNLNAPTRRALHYVCQDHGDVEVVEKLFEVSLDDALSRNALRAGIARVPDDVVMSMHKQATKLVGSMSTVCYNLPARVSADRSLRSAIICDLDGTLAHLNGRNPYDTSQCYNDKCNFAVADVIDTMVNHCPRRPRLLFVSGREDKYREATEVFLSNNIGGPETYELFMRKTGDLRRDATVKLEIFEQNIRGQYDVMFVLDDRNSVVDMWRQLGLQCWQVAEGRF